MASLHYFACGETTHGMHQLLRGASRERRVFPSGVFLYSAGSRRVLFDTGYAPEPWRAGAAGWAYRRLLPPTVPQGVTVEHRLDPASVTHVVLSHLHPDHVGGIRAFPDATIVLTEGLHETLRSPRLREGVLGGLIPPWLEGRATVLPSAAFDASVASGAAIAGLRTADLFGDGSYRLVDLPGHARGHVGALVEDDVLLAADAAWARDLLGEEGRIKPLPRAVAHDSRAQTITAQALLAAERQGVRLLFSHDRHPTGVDLLRGGA
ncbi:MBL fold metallo-hydrolase [Frondihabitans sp. PAMC 28766]|uniref:MBL fold metallo-hydrolase n=1 Tax=Frondihabitans sp. PAMC 28766 TaxID=1795630 RepID=UPI0012FF93E6|nr:MBL fold metallo-hydrolase [Frondihabitans sp. PAMC 28766]